MWLVQAALYGVLKGGRDVMKKIALTKSSQLEGLFFYTLLSFFLVFPKTGVAVEIFNGQTVYLPLIFVKSAVIYVAWI